MKMLTIVAGAALVASLPLLAGAGDAPHRCQASPRQAALAEYLFYHGLATGVPPAPHPVCLRRASGTQTRQA